MPRPKQQPKADLFEIPRTVAETSRIAREIGAPLDARRLRSIAAADTMTAAFLDRTHRRRKKPKPKRKPRPRPSFADYDYDDEDAVERLTERRLRTLLDAVDAGAPPATVVELAKKWRISPDLWWKHAQDLWSAHDDWEDVTARAVFSNWYDSPEGMALPNA